MGMSEKKAVGKCFGGYRSGKWGIRVMTLKEWERIGKDWVFGESRGGIRLF